MKKRIKSFLSSKTVLVFAVFCFIAISFSIFGTGDETEAKEEKKPPQEEIEATTVTPEDSNVQTQNGYTINFNNVSINQFVRFVANITKKNFIFNEAELNFPVTIYSKEPTSLENVMAAFVQILRLHDFGIVQQGNNYLIIKDEAKSKVAKTATIVSAELDNIDKADPTLVTRVFKLANVDPTKILKTIQSMLSKNSLIEASQETSHLILTDIGANINKVEKLLLSLDKPDMRLEIDHYKVKTAFASTLIDLTKKILHPITGGDKNSFEMVSYPASNTIFIISTPFLIEKTKNLLTSLDIPEIKEEEEEVVKETTTIKGKKVKIKVKQKKSPSKVAQTNFFHYELQYYKGDKISASLKSLAQSMQGTAKEGESGAPGHYGALIKTINSMQWIDNTNSLLFFGDPSTLSKLELLLKTLDSPPKQVFIEVLVVEKNINDDFNFGVEWGSESSRSSNIGPKRTGSYYLGGGLGESNKIHLNSDQLNIGDISHSIAGKGFNLAMIGKKISINGKKLATVGAVINAVKTDRNTKILMTPKIVTQNNFKATIFSGEERPFIKDQFVREGTETKTGTSVEYKNVGSSLEVTPIISGDNTTITLDITQKIEAVSQETVPLGTATVPVTKRTETTTRVHVPNKHFLVLGGQIIEEETKTKSHIPCLGGLPVVGAAFKNTNDSKKKNQIMIFLRPEIVQTPEEFIALSKKEREKVDKDLPGIPSAKRDMNLLLDAFNLAR